MQAAGIFRGLLSGLKSGRRARPGTGRTIIAGTAVVALLGATLSTAGVPVQAPLLSAQPPVLGCSSASTAGGTGFGDATQASLRPTKLPAYQAIVDPALGTTAKTASTMSYDGAKLVVGYDAVPYKMSVGVASLATDAEVPPLDSGMTNVTQGPRRGWQFTPHPYTFLKKIQVSLPYDPKAVGQDLEDLYTYYFDEDRGCWRPLERVQVDALNHTVISLTDHFTDMINATVVVPDHPGDTSFDPTQLKNIQAADPGNAVNLIQPPGPANSGEARLNYPIQVPPGRAGLEPKLSVAYSSAGANGWLGVGWDLAMPSITIDTRWGVPRYDAQRETETYQMAGEMLTPVAHRGPPVARTADKVFHTRAEGQFQKIIRHGDAPDNYTWEVVDRSGTRYFYGATPGDGPQADATLTDDAGHVFLWALREVRDRHGNTMMYHNVRVTDDGIAAGGSVPGRDLYVHEITYTGNGDAEGPYTVTLIRDRELSEPRRKDVMISARGGFKRVTADLLRRIDVRLSGALVRRYELNYETGAFDKTLLKSISQFGEDGRLFNTHEFGYFDDIRDAQGNYDAFRQVNWGSPDDNVNNGTVNAVSGGAGEAGALGGNSSTNAGGHLYVGFGESPTKSGTVGVKTGFDRGNDEGLLALTDVDGDDLPDKVFKDGGTIKYRKNLSKPGGEPRFSDTVQPLRNLPGILSDQTDSLTLGVEGYIGAVAAQLDDVDATSTTDRYFADVNGDGITDLVDGGNVLFGRVGPDGVPVYGLAADTPAPIGSSTVDPNGVLGDFTADRDRQNDSFPLVDSVRRWIAPFDGTVAVTGAVQLRHVAGTDQPRFAKPDGVRVAIQHENAELWSQAIGADDFAAHAPDGVDAVAVHRGDRLYFRVGSNFDGSADQVSWDPKIDYVGVPDLTDVNGLTPYGFQASRDFTLGGRTSEVTVPTDGTMHLGGTFAKNGATTDDLTVQITQNGDPVFEKDFAAAATGDVTVDKDIQVSKGQKLAWRVKVDSPIDLGKISWTPAAHYTAAPGVSRFFDENGNPLLKVEPPFDIDMYPGDDLTAPQQSFTVPADGTLDVRPRLSFDFGGATPDARVVFTVKRQGVLVAKKVIQITNGQLPDPADLALGVPAQAGQELFFDFSTTDRKLASFLTGQGVTVDGAAAPSAFHHSVDEGAFAQPYRGWAAIGYNGNKDRATQPIKQTDLVVDDNFKDQLPGDVDPQRDKDTFTADPRIDPPKAIVFAPQPATGRWAAGETSFVAKDSVSSSRLGGQSINLPAAADLAGGTAVPRIGRSNQISLTGSVSGGIGSIGGSVATGDSTGELDYLDLNGDGYPDVAGAGGVQYTDPTGTLGGTHGSLPDGSVRRSHNVSGNASAGSAARTIVTGHGRAAPQGNGTANTSQTGNDMPPLGVGGDMGTGTSDSKFDLLDVNGDELPDRVYENGQVALNLGYRFEPTPEPWPGGTLNAGKSSNAGVNIGFNTDFYGFAGGASFNQGDSDSDGTLQDVNGDGLADRVFAGSPIKVAINRGNGFAPPVPFSGSLSDINADVNAKLGGGAYIEFGICFLVGCVVFNPGVNFATGASRTQQTLRDINGDGFADHLQSTRDNQLTVAENQTGRTNLLKTVTRPMGSRIDLDYARDGNTYDQPHSRYVMSKATVDDGHPGDGPDVQMTTYTYSGGVYDRQEREFYGYRTVTESHHDTANGNAVFSTITRDYLNTSYYTRGLQERELLADGQGRPFHELKDTYVLKDVNTGATQADPHSTTATIFPEQVRTDDSYFEGQAQPGKTTHIEMDYDDFGNMVHSLDVADTGTADDIDTRASYSSSDSACRASNIVGTPTSIEVRGGGGGGTVLRHREATVDCDTGDVTQDRAMLADGSAAVTDLSYFGNGNLASVTNPANKNGQRYKLSYTYDTTVDTHVATIVDSFGLRSSMTYDFKYGKVETTTDTNNQREVETYDTVGRVASVTGPYELAENRHSIDFDYHPEAPTPYAVTRHVDRQADGTVRPDTIDTVTFTDGLKRVLQTKKDAAVSTGLGGPPADVMVVSGREIFDAFGRTVQQYFQTTEPKGAGNTAFNPAFDDRQPTRKTFDVMDRTTKTVLPDDTVSTNSYGFGADRAGAQQFENVATDAKGNVTRTYTDVTKRITSVKQRNPAGDQPVIWTSYAYNAIGETTAVTDDKNNVTRSAYDNFGRRTVLDSPDQGRTQTVYDLAGNPIQEITAKLAAAGKAIDYDYDFNRITAIRYPLFPANNVTYSYGAPGAAGNAAGRVTAITDGAGTMSRQYGPLGEVTSETRAVPVQGNKTRTFTTQYSYDSWNRVLRLTYPDGEVLSYGYDSGGMVNSATGVKGDFSYPYLKRLDYDKFGQRVLMQTGNGVTTRYAYNADDRRLASLQSNLSMGYQFQNLSYTYDDVGNVTSIDDDTVPPDGPDVGFQVGGPSHQTFKYDDLYQLTQAQGEYTSRGPKTDRYTLEMSYDSIHNITEKNQQQTLDTNGNVVVQKKTTFDNGYTYGSGKPHAASALGPYTMAYDANGNLISRSQQPRPTRQLIWDEENRLACDHENVQSKVLAQDASSCDNPGGAPDARYAYDYAGNRIVKDSAQTHIYPNQNYSTDGNKEYKHIYVGSTRVATKFVEPDKRFEDRQFYSHDDHLGSTGFVTDVNGQLYEHLNYFPSGETWVDEHQDPGQPVPFQYTGKELDPETDYYYYGARYYDPRTSLWQSPDPALDDYLDGQPNNGVYSSINLADYTYANNNPVRLTDPDGRWVHIVIGAGVGALIGAGIEGYHQYKSGEFNGMRLLGAAGGGAVAGAVSAATAGLGTAAVTAVGGGAVTSGVVATGVAAGTGAVSSAAGAATTALIQGDDVGQAAKEGAISGAIGGAGGAAAGQVLKAVGGRVLAAAESSSSTALRSIADKMKPYAPGGGHHPVAKAAFRDAENYPKEGLGVLAVPNEVLRELKVNHGDITKAQQLLYRAWRAKNPTATPTFETIREIETQAMVDAKMSPDAARAFVDKAIKELQDRGVKGPTRIPWVDD